MAKDTPIDKFFLGIVLGLLVLGFLIFISASFSVLARDSNLFDSIAFKQAFFGILLGLTACFIFSKLNYKILRRYSLFIFIGSLILTLLVFIPHVGITINGARRWIEIFGLSVQPTAFLNIGFIIWWASWLSIFKDKVSEIKYGLLPLIIVLGFIGAILLSQPDTDSFVMIGVTGALMLMIAGARFKHILILVLILPQTFF